MLVAQALPYSLPVHSSDGDVEKAEEMDVRECPSAEVVKPSPPGASKANVARAWSQSTTASQGASLSTFGTGAVLTTFGSNGSEDTPQHDDLPGGCPLPPLIEATMSRISSEELPPEMFAGMHDVGDAESPLLRSTGCDISDSAGADEASAPAAAPEVVVEEEGTPKSLVQAARDKFELLSFRGELTSFDSLPAEPRCKKTSSSLSSKIEE